MIDLDGTSGSIGIGAVVADDCATSEAAAALCGGGLDGSFAASVRGLSLAAAGVEATGPMPGAGGPIKAGASCGFAMDACGGGLRRLARAPCVGVGVCLAMATVTESSPCSSRVTLE